MKCWIPNGWTLVPVIGLVLALSAAPLRAQSKVVSKTAQEAADYLLRRFGKKVLQEGTESLAQRIERYAAKHGDDFLHAVRKIGPQAFTLVDDVGGHGAKAARVLAQHGEQAAAHIVGKPKAMALFLKHGDDCAKVLCDHPGITEPLIEQFGEPAVRAFAATNAQNARRVAMLAGGEFSGKAGQILEAVGKYGDRAAEFIWRNKGALAVGGALTAFVANPEPFINGTQTLVGSVAENAVRPLAEVPGAVASGIVRSADWTLVLVAMLVAGVGLTGAWLWVRRPAAPGSSVTPGAMPRR